MLFLTIGFLAACDGGPGNNNTDSGAVEMIDVTDVSNNHSSSFEVTPDGIYLDGVDTVEIDVAVEINGEETSCQANFYVKSTDGWVELHIDTGVQTTVVVPKGATVKWSAGDDREGYLTAHEDENGDKAGLPMHGEPDGVEYFSTWNESTVDGEMDLSIPLTAYVNGTYKCFAVERYGWNGESWTTVSTMDELDDYVEHFTDSNGMLIATEGHIFGTMTGTVRVDGKHFVLVEDTYDSLTDTWITELGLGATVELSEWSRDVIEWYPK